MVVSAIIAASRPLRMPITVLHTVQTMAAQGLTTIRSSLGPEETMNRFEAEVRARGMTAFAHIDHAAGAAAVDCPCGRPSY